MFRCTTTHPSTGCYLYLEGQIRAQILPRERGDYNLSLVQEGDSSHYSCQCYTFNASREWSAVSNTLRLVRLMTQGCQCRVQVQRPIQLPSLFFQNSSFGLFEHSGKGAGQLLMKV
ncbi:hypothetical protein DV515_00018581 [Chloebia gouldiae]|uniref:Uncharacterized protein n=1 Tax=Chloebia gouldiae TaxID=44316 RepID=A0A3L8Q768_CHLGU|nr:hypothetical protein DV515_00018581 [Chloebia gouldiae]